MERGRMLLGAVTENTWGHDESHGKRPNRKRQYPASKQVRQRTFN